MTTSTDYPNRVAVVTGASGALGSAISRRLADDGLGVVVHFSRHEGPALDLVAEITGAGGRAVAIGGDVADPATFDRLFDTAEAHFGGADVLVATAGLSRLGALAAASYADYDAVFDASARGTLNGLRAATARLRDGGRVITFSTTALAATTPGMGVYMAAKAAVESLTRSAAKELAPRGITVNAIAPGAIASPMFFDGKTEEQISTITRSHPAGRLGSPADIAAAVSLLSGGDAAWISGQVIRVNGGIA